MEESQANGGKCSFGLVYDDCALGKKEKKLPTTERYMESPSIRNHIITLWFYNNDYNNNNAHNDIDVIRVSFKAVYQLQPAKYVLEDDMSLAIYKITLFKFSTLIIFLSGLPNI